MPPAFVLSQDQTLRKYLTKSFSSSSSFHCSVAFSSTGFCSLGCLIFKEQPAASATAHLYYHSSLLSVKNFFKFFKRFACWALVTLAPTRMYYTRTFSFRQPLFPSFFAFSFLFLGFVFFFLLFFRSLFIFPTFWY